MAPIVWCRTSWQLWNIQQGRDCTDGALSSLAMLLGVTLPELNDVESAYPSSMAGTSLLQNSSHNMQGENRHDEVTYMPCHGHITGILIIRTPFHIFVAAVSLNR